MNVSETEVFRALSLGIGMQVCGVCVNYVGQQERLTAFRSDKMPQKAIIQIALPVYSKSTHFILI